MHEARLDFEDPEFRARAASAIRAGRAVTFAIRGTALVQLETHVRDNRIDAGAVATLPALGALGVVLILAEARSRRVTLLRATGELSVHIAAAPEPLASMIEYDSLASPCDLDAHLATGASLFIRVRGTAFEGLRRIVEGAAFGDATIGAVRGLELLAEILRGARAEHRSVDIDSAYEHEIWVAIGAGKPKRSEEAPLPYSIAGTSFELFVHAIASREDRAKILGDDIPVIPPTADFGYEGVEPLNALTFAQMGVDGVHDAIVAVSGTISETSPVIQISPMDSDAHCVLAASFIEYLAVACAVSRKRMGSVLASERAGLDVLVPFLAAHFDRSRLFDDEQRLRALERYLPLVQIPAV